MWIDTHVHLYDITRRETEWPTSLHPPELYHNSYPDDFREISRGTGIEKAVSVECVYGDRFEEINNLWTLELAERSDSIGAAVASIPPDVDREVFSSLYNRYCRYGKFRGIRIRPDISLSRLEKLNRNLDCFERPADIVEIVPAHFSNMYAVEPLIANHPDLRFVIDHFAWFSTDGKEPPALFTRMLDDLSAHRNVFVKLSGLFERAALRPSPAEAAYYEPMISAVLERFGADRCMFGSDWPPCSMFGTYRGQVELTVSVLERCGSETTDRVMGANAAEVYGIS